MMTLPYASKSLKVGGRSLFEFSSIEIIFGDRIILI
jgi:hypothetical protein